MGPPSIKKSKDNKEMETKHILDKVGQQCYGGWTPAGKAAFDEHKKNVIAARSLEHVAAIEMEALYRIHKNHQDAMAGKKKKGEEDKEIKVVQEESDGEGDWDF